MSADVERARDVVRRIVADWERAGVTDGDLVADVSIVAVRELLAALQDAPDTEARP